MSHFHRCNEQTLAGFVWVPGVPDVGQSGAECRGEEWGAQGWSPEGQLSPYDPGHGLGLSYLLCKVGVVIPALGGCRLNSLRAHCAWPCSQPSA